MRNVLVMEIIVPDDWDDDRIIQYAENQNPSGVSEGWQISEKIPYRGQVKVTLDVYHCGCGYKYHIDLGKYGCPNCNGDQK